MGEDRRTRRVPWPRWCCECGLTTTQVTALPSVLRRCAERVPDALDKAALRKFCGVLNEMLSGAIPWPAVQERWVAHSPLVNAFDEGVEGDRQVISRAWLRPDFSPNRELESDCMYRIHRDLRV